MLSVDLQDEADLLQLNPEQEPVLEMANEAVADHEAERVTHVLSLQLRQVGLETCSTAALLPVLDLRPS